MRLQGPVAKLPIPPRPVPAILADAPPAAAPTPPATVPEPALPPPLASAEPDPAPVTGLPAAPPKTAMAALPPLTAAPTSALAETPPAAPAPPPVRTSAKPKPTPGPAVAALEPEPELEAASATELVFDNNSSYLPDGASKQLKRWIASLPKARGYRIELAAAVGTADAKTTDPKQAARYGRWLAERRLGRISEWLEKNVEVRDLQLQQKFLENDSSRRVVVRASPVT